MKSIFKRGASILWALIMCLFVIAGFSTTAFAAEDVTNQAYLVAFPRGEDADGSGAWGHGNLNFMNGWSKPANAQFSLHSLGSYSGAICYCIEPGVSQNVGDTLICRDENFWLNYPSDFNQTIQPDDIKLLIGRILQYGYTGNISTSWRVDNGGADSLAHAIATQLLIWETVVGERDENFVHVDTGGYDAVLDQIGENHPLRSQILSHYASIEKSVQNHTTVPSFCARSIAEAQTVDLEWNGSEYSVTLTDRNHVLEYYTFSANDSDIHFSVNGNQLTISSKTAPSDRVTVSAEKGTSSRRTLITWTDEIISPDGQIQDVVTFGEEVRDPVKGYLYLSVSYGSAKIIKTSEDGKVDGLTFHISGNGIDETVVTQNGGQILLDNLQPGVYTVTEQSYDQYEPQESRSVTVAAGQTATVTFSNTLKRGDLKVTKSAEDNFVEGVKFHLYGTSESSIVVDEYAVTTADGVAEFKGVLIGSGYILEEVDTDERYVVPESRTVTIEWNQVGNQHFENVLRKYKVKVIKLDAETGKTISYAGAGFKIYKPNGSQVILADGSETFYTGDDGSLTLPEMLPYGEGYALIEVQAPYGYVADETPVFFDLTGESTLVTVSKSNVSQKGIIRISKTGEQFSSVTVTGGGYPDEDSNEIVFPNVYQPVYEAAGLEGAVYEVTAAEDIYTLDGTLRCSRGEIVATLTTDSDGTAATDPLYLGSYEIREIKAPYGMVLNPETKSVQLTYAGQEIEITETAASFYNERQRVQIDLTKMLEQDEAFRTGMNGEITSVSFGLYAAEDLIAADGSAIPADGLIEIAGCEEDGYAAFTTDLPVGAKLYVKEISTDSHYILSDEKYPVEFVYAGQDVGIVNLSVNDGEPIENDIIYGTIKGLKIDRETEDSIAGAIFGLFREDEAEYTEETASLTAESGEDGVFTFEYVPYGSWIVRELKPAVNYLLSDEIYFITVSEDEDVIEIIAVNDQIPELSTAAAVNGKKEIVADGTITVEDVVSYKHLIPGKEYTVKGILMNKSTGKPLLVNGEEIRSEVTFVPENADGEVTVSFTFNSSAIQADTEIVVFESLYYEGTELAVHADIEDTDQTVSIHPQPTPDVPQTGDNFSLGFWIGLGAIAIGGLVSTAIIYFKKKKDDENE